MKKIYFYLFIILVSLLYGVKNEISINFVMSPSNFDYQFLSEDEENKISEFLEPVQYL